MAAHLGMSKENGHVIPESARFWRAKLADSWVSEKVFPIRYTDPYNTMDQLCDHLKKGHSAVVDTTHPGLEDLARDLKFLLQWDAVRQRRIVGPAAVHWMSIVEPISHVFALESSPVVTEHSLQRKNYDRKTQAKYLQDYSNLMTDSLAHNSVLVATSSADQASLLVPPAKAVLGFILSRTEKAHISDVMYVPMGIEIEGLTDYSGVRDISLQRHPYIFHVGKSYTDEELRKISTSRNITPDYFMYLNQRELVPPGYRSE